jgi:hypothetical protein
MLLEWGIGAILDCDPNSRNTLAGQPAAYTAVGIFSGSGGERQVAWGNRGVHTAAAVCPLVMPDSSDIHGCLSGMSDDTCAVSLAVYTSNILGTYASTNGLFGPYGGPATGGPTIYQDSFQSTYTRMAMCLAAGARENPDALVILQKMADWHAYLVSKFGYYYTTGYFNKTGMANTDINVGWPAISVDEQYATTTPFVASWTTSSPNWTLVRATAGNGAVVRDGDRFMFEKNPPLPPPISVTLNSPTNYLRDTPYYAINTIAVNATTYTCNMTTVLGSAGNILVPAAPGSGGANATYHWYVGQDVAPAIGAENTGYQNQGSYMSWKRSSHLWMKALGITGLDAAITDAGLRFDHAGFLAVVRGAFQDHFGA